MFAVRIVTADYYLANPIKNLDVCYSEFRESNVKKVPVVRIFGATPAGQFSVAVVVCFWWFLLKGNVDCGSRRSVLTHRRVFAALCRCNVAALAHVRPRLHPPLFSLTHSRSCPPFPWWQLWRRPLALGVPFLPHVTRISHLTVLFN